VSDIVDSRYTRVPPRVEEGVVRDLGWDMVPDIGTTSAVLSPVGNYSKMNVFRPDPSATPEQQKKPVQNYPYDPNWKVGYGFDISNGTKRVLTGKQAYFNAKWVATRSDELGTKPILWYFPTTLEKLKTQRGRDSRAIRRWPDQPKRCKECRSYEDDGRCKSYLCPSNVEWGDPVEYEGGCPECGSEKNDVHDNYMFCQDCGLVLDSLVIEKSVFDVETQVKIEKGEFKDKKPLKYQPQLVQMYRRIRVRLDLIRKKVNEKLGWDVDEHLAKRVFDNFTELVTANSPEKERDRRRYDRHHRHLEFRHGVFEILNWDKDEGMTRKQQKIRLRDHLEKEKNYNNNDPEGLILIRKADSKDGKTGTLLGELRNGKILHYGEKNLIDGPDLGVIMAGNAWTIEIFPMRNMNGYRLGYKPFIPTAPASVAGEKLMEIFNNWTPPVPTYKFQDYLWNSKSSCPLYYLYVVLGLVILSEAKYTRNDVVTISNEKIAELHRLLLDNPEFECICPDGGHSEKEGRRKHAWSPLSIVSVAEFIRRYVVVCNQDNLTWEEWI